MNRADEQRWQAWADGLCPLAAWETPRSVVRELLAAIPPQPAINKVLADLQDVTSLRELIQEVSEAERAFDRAEATLQDVGEDIGRLARALEEFNRSRKPSNPAGRP